MGSLKCTYLSTPGCPVVSLKPAKLLVQFGLMDHFSSRSLYWASKVECALFFCLVIKDLHNNVKAKRLYAGALSREIDILQGTGQGRILASFMYKVYINSLLKVLTKGR